MHALLVLVAGVNLLSSITFDNGNVMYALEDSRAVPVAIITYSTFNGGSTVEDGETVVFDGISSYDPDGGSILKYRWRINGSLQGTAWTFDLAAGTSQTVKLSIWDDENEYRETTETLTVIAGGNQPPFASFTPGGSTVDDNETVNFVSTSSDSDGSITLEEWFVNGLGGTPDGAGGSFGWTFDLATGTTQTIYLVVTDDESARDTTSEVFTVQQPGAQTVTRHYYLKDHLGSTRVTVDDEGTVVHYADYYPFGMLLPDRSLVSSTDEPKELYTGHEHDDETGLYYAGARYYDPMIARWGSVDPLGGDLPNQSTFNYVLNDPMNLVDPDGLCPIAYFGSDGVAVCEEVVVYGEKPLNGASDAFLLNNTFYFNPKSPEGKEGLDEFLKSNTGLIDEIISSDKFSISAKKIALRRKIVSGQEEFMRLAALISLSSGADAASVISMFSGVGSVGAIGALALKRRSVSLIASSITKQQGIRALKASSTLGISSAGISLGLNSLAVPVGGSPTAVVHSAVGFGLSGFGQVLPALGAGLRFTGLSGPIYRSAASGRFVGDAAGLALNGSFVLPSVAYPLLFQGR